MDYCDLQIWQRAIDLSMHIYELTLSFPKEETYGLIAQMRRSAVSVASNIAEGEGRLTPGERRNALSQARGSLFELSTHIVLLRSSDI
jgi:four helix bundle protein